ncbi:MAG: dihydropteroate synthase [Candidatus Sumerlaeia bacterium]|nr:dihydropteroate synthase [Candidatus Sumerlaeia bacterium]
MNRWNSLFSPQRSRPAILAVLNASPESFYAGSVETGAGEIARRVRRMEADGADAIDIGARSSAPYKETAITLEEEVRRMAHAVRAARAATTLPISADTPRAEVARAALDEGADAVNDITALEGDPAMGRLIAERRCGGLLMVNDSPTLDEQGQPPHRVVARLFEAAARRALDAGIPRDAISLDPGVGFFRQRSLPWHQWDLDVIAHIGEYAALGYPVVLGASRKSFLGPLLGRTDAADRLAGSLALAAWAAMRNTAMLRVHDVAETRDVLEVLSLLSSKQSGQ